jgi:hypothetical protein
MGSSSTLTKALGFPDQEPLIGLLLQGLGRVRSDSRLVKFRILVSCERRGDGDRKRFPTKPPHCRSCALGDNMNRKNAFATVALTILALAGSGRAAAQDPADEDIKLFRKDLRSLRKQIIAANMNLSDKEAEQFWPLFERYTQELVAKQDGKYALLKEYADNYTTLTDERAEKYVRGRADVDEAILQVRLKYFPLFRKVLSGKSTALFFQLDWRLGLIMDLQLASQTPLIEP